MHVIGYLVLILVLIVSKNGSQSTNIESITVATYNVWNIMFNWEVRKFRIAQMIKETDPHVIAFQELRTSEKNDVNLGQLSDLQDLLPKYRWQHLAIAHPVPHAKEYYSKEWDLEGIGVLSRLPIVRHEVQHLSTSTSPDKNTRVFLHIQVLLDQSFFPDTSQVLNIIVAHLSYDRQQQCNNAVEIYQYIHDREMRNTIILGDFNTYKNYEVPQSIFTQKLNSSSSGNQICKPDLRRSFSALVNRHIVFEDAWFVTNPKKPGFSFSNMPIPGLESRPDRILFCTKDFAVRSTDLIGDGSKYRAKYFYNVIWNRMENVIASSYASYAGLVGRPCAYDCGPHGSCRCGVCVTGGDDKFCHLPECEECGATTFKTLAAFALLFALLLAQLIFAALQVLLAMNNRSRFSYSQPASARSKWFCCNLCLCDPSLYSNLSAKIRGMKRRKLCKIWPFLRLPPMILTIVTLVMMFVLVEFAIFAFKDAIDDVYSIIPEELNPSDHLMVHATLNIVK